MAFAAVGFIMIFYFAFLIGLYVVQVWGLYKMAKFAGIPNPWLAFVPVGGNYIAGLLAERARYTYTGQKSRLAFWNVTLTAVSLGAVVLIFALALTDMDFNPFVGLTFFVLMVTTVAASIVFFYSLYYIFKDYAPDNAVLYTVLGIVFSIYWIFLLVVMNHVPVSVTGFGGYPYGRPKYDKYGNWPQNPPQQGGYPGAGYGPQPGGPYTTGPQSGYTTGPQSYGQTPGYGPQTGGTYTTGPNSGISGNPQYPGYGPQGGGPYTTQPGDQPGCYPPPHDFSGGYDPAKNFPSGGYDPQNPQSYPPPRTEENKKDEHTGPEL